MGVCELLTELVEDGDALRGPLLRGQHMGQRERRGDPTSRAGDTHSGGEVLRRIPGPRLRLGNTEVHEQSARDASSSGSSSARWR